MLGRDKIENRATRCTTPRRSSSDGAERRCARSSSPSLAASSTRACAFTVERERREPLARQRLDEVHALGVDARGERAGHRVAHVGRALAPARTARRARARSAAPRRRSAARQVRAHEREQRVVQRRAAPLAARAAASAPSSAAPTAEVAALIAPEMRSEKAGSAPG